MSNTVAGAAPVRPAKLPVLATAIEAYRRLFSHGWVYAGEILLLTALAFAVLYTLYPAGWLLQKYDLPPEQVLVIWQWLTAGLKLAVTALLCVSHTLVGLSCQRAILAGEPPSLRQLLRPGWRHLRYLALWLFCVILLFVPVLLLVFSVARSGAAGPSSVAIFLTLVASLLWISVLAPFLVLAFPAVALDRPRAIAESFRRSRGQRIQLFGLLLALYVPLGIVGFIVLLVSRMFDLPIIGIANWVLQLTATLILAAGSSVAWQRLADDKESRTAAKRAT